LFLPQPSRDRSYRAHTPADPHGKLPLTAQLLMHADLADMCASVVMAAERQSCLLIRLCSLISSSPGRRVLRR